MFLNRICNYVTGNQTYNILVPGNTVEVIVTRDAAIVLQWLKDMVQIKRNHYFLSHGKLIVGIGIKWKSRSGVGPRGSRADTLQLCIANRCLIYQIGCSMYVPIELRYFLMDPRCTFVGFWTQYDKKLLNFSPHELDIHMVPMDLRRFLNDKLAQSSTGWIIRCRLELEGKHDFLTRETFASDWSVYFLSDEQILLASVEAYCAFWMGVQHRAWAYRSESLGWSIFTYLDGAPIHYFDEWAQVSGSGDQDLGSGNQQNAMVHVHNPPMANYRLF